MQRRKQDGMHMILTGTGYSPIAHRPRHRARARGTRLEEAAREGEAGPASSGDGVDVEL